MVEEQEVEAREEASSSASPSTSKRGGKKGTRRASQDDKKNANGKRGRPRVDAQSENAVEVRGSCLWHQSRQKSADSS